MRVSAKDKTIFSAKCGIPQNINVFVLAFCGIPQKYLYSENNPPKVLVEFFPNQKNLQNITCYSNEGNKWRKSEISFENEYKLKISINEKFTTERGRINCSLNDNEGWRWFGIQFVIKEY